MGHTLNVYRPGLSQPEEREREQHSRCGQGSRGDRYVLAHVEQDCIEQVFRTVRNVKSTAKAGKTAQSSLQGQYVLDDTWVAAGSHGAHCVCMDSGSAPTKSL